MGAHGAQPGRGDERPRPRHGRADGGRRRPLGEGATGRGLVARGLGRSYGDAAQNAGGVVLDLTGLDALHRADLAKGEVEVGAGISLQTLMERLVPLGWFVPVTPGTRYVTVGGAIAADIHGKNHHVDGSFSRHVGEVQLVTPSGTVTVSPEQDAELFWATAGGMGLTGFITRATLQMIPVETSYILVDTERAPDLDTVMSMMISGDDAYRYSVAWIDCQAGGSRLGRSVLTRGDHARQEDLPVRLRGERARAFVGRQRLQVPITPPSGLLNPLTVAAFNELWFHKAPNARSADPPRWRPSSTRSTVSVDGTGSTGAGASCSTSSSWETDRARPCARCSSDWPRHDSDRSSASSSASARPTRGRSRFHRPVGRWRSICPSGRKALGSLLDELDDAVVEAGGRVYLAKDARLAPERFRAMYPRVDEWLAVRERVDPDGRTAVGPRAPTRSQPRSPRWVLPPEPGNATDPPASTGVRTPSRQPTVGPRPCPAGGARVPGRATMPGGSGRDRRHRAAAVHLGARWGIGDRPGRRRQAGGGRTLPDRGPGRPAERPAHRSRSIGPEPAARRRSSRRVRRHRHPPASVRPSTSVFDRFGGLDVVLVAAGQLGDQETLEHDPEATAALITTNFTGLAAALVAVSDRMRRQGHGRIVVLSSVAGDRPRRANFVYGVVEVRSRRLRLRPGRLAGRFRRRPHRRSSGVRRRTDDRRNGACALRHHALRRWPTPSSVPSGGRPRSSTCHRCCGGCSPACVRSPERSGGDCPAEACSPVQSADQQSLSLSQVPTPLRDIWPRPVRRRWPLAKVTTTLRFLS